MGRKSKNSKKSLEEESSGSRIEDKQQQPLDDDTEVESGSTSISRNEVKGKPEYTLSSAAKRKNNKEKKDASGKSEGSRMLILFRNAEQMDKIFPEWMHKNFVDGKYTPTDMNQPIQLPFRKTPLVVYENDPPLTEMGIRISQLIGKSMTENGIILTAIYSSPSLRCIQTAQNLIKAQLTDLRIQIEPAFYDFAGHKGKEIPIFMLETELAENNIPIDKNYRPITSIADLSKFATETPAEFFKRQSNNIYNLTKRSPTGTVLIVTHACTIHAAAVAFKPSPDGLWTIASQVLPSLNFSYFSNRFNHHFFTKNG